jgi:hypothetical protein
MEESTGTELAQKLERLYEREFIHRFPHQDCYKLQKIRPRMAHWLVPDLDGYFSFIAGTAQARRDFIKDRNGNFALLSPNWGDLSMRYARNTTDWRNTLRTVRRPHFFMIWKLQTGPGSVSVSQLLLPTCFRPELWMVDEPVRHERRLDFDGCNSRP